MTEITDFSRLCVHTITTKPWDITTAAQKFAASKIGGITIWRDAVINQNLTQVKSMLGGLGVEVVSLCRGGFFPSVDPQKRKLAIDDNLRAIDQAHALGAPMMVMVCGADPRQSLEDSRKQIAEGIMTCLDHASAAKVQLTIEPLHPMYAGDRSAINTLAQANDMAEEIDSPWVGIALDVYHLWWDSDLERQIERCGINGNLSAFHICDWKTPTLDMLNDRGLMGEGCIDLKRIRGWVEKAGFKGFHEAEIFSNIYWQQDQDLYLEKIKDAYLKYS